MPGLYGLKTTRCFVLYNYLVVLNKVNKSNKLLNKFILAYILKDLYKTFILSDLKSFGRQIKDIVILFWGLLFEMNIVKVSLKL